MVPGVLNKINQGKPHPNFQKLIGYFILEKSVTWDGFSALSKGSFTHFFFFFYI